jgi:hypothetical protein
MHASIRREMFGDSKKTARLVISMSVAEATSLRTALETAISTLIANEENAQDFIRDDPEDKEMEDEARELASATRVLSKLQGLIPK